MEQFFDIEQAFADHFEPDGADFLYRRKLHSPGIRVTPAERDQFILDFARRRKIQHRSTVGIVVAISGVVVSGAFTGAKPAELQIGIFVTTLAWSVAVSRWVWNAPWRSLRCRPAADSGRSKAESTRMKLQKLSWAKLGWVAAALVAGLIELNARESLLTRWNWLWLVVFAGLFALIAIQAIRKLRLQ